MSKLFSLTALVAAGLVATSASAQVNLTAETANAAGIPGNTVLALAEYASEGGIANIQVATGQTLTNSVQNLAEGKTDISATPFILPFLLSRGAGPYAALGAEKGKELSDGLAVLYTYRLGTFALYAYDSKGVKGWGDLAGRTIYNGPPRGAAVVNARAVIKLATGLEEGEGYTGVQVNWDQAVKTITDGTADAQVLPIGMPDGRITAALSAGNVTLWSYPKEIFEAEATQKYMKAPGSGATVIGIADMGFTDGVTIVSEDDMFRGVATVGGEIVRKDMDFDLAKSLTAAFIANIEKTHARAPFLKTAAIGETDPGTTGMCGAMPLKYHPGAVAAWEEAGYTLPDCAK